VAEIVALAQHQVEALPDERHEIEGGRLRHRARRDAAISAAGAHRLRDVGAGRADRLHGSEPIERQAGTGDKREQEQLRAGALRPQRETRPRRGDRGDVEHLQGIAGSYDQSLLAPRKSNHDGVVQARRIGDGFDVRGLVVTVEPMQMDRRNHDLAAREPLPRGLETGLGGSINVETIELLAQNVAGGTRGGLANVSIEQVLLWNPDVIITIDQDFAATVFSDPTWAPVAAVRARRVHLSPKLPFGWVDFPPSVNRLIGLWWLGKILYPDLFPEDLRTLTREFYARYYHVTPDAAQIDRVLAGRD
jgi:hypothetical protein